MRIPRIRGLIERRILVNYRVDAGTLARLLPPPFRLQLVAGRGMAGVCLIRLSGVRPRFLPRALGLRSENAAHRIAVAWDDADGTRTGVFVPRRDTSSRLNSLVGGRLFPGVHHHARFEVREHEGRYRVALRSDDGTTRLVVEGRVARNWPGASVFASLDEASQFFANDAVGYSPGRVRGEFDGLELRCRNWSMQALAIDHVESTFFADSARFPPGTVEFDCALLMQGIEHEWHGRESIRTAAPECLATSGAGMASAAAAGS